MKKPYLLDPKRANDPDVIAAYQVDLDQFRGHANFAELDRLVQRATDIKHALEIARSRKNQRHIRVLTPKLRGAKAAIRNWISGYAV
jgi:hypothetical protein